MEQTTDNPAATSAATPAPADDAAPAPATDASPGLVSERPRLTPRETIRMAYGLGAAITLLLCLSIWLLLRLA